MRKYRMYSFVLRQLNPMQKGVQTTHAVVEFANRYGDTIEYQSWSKNDKTLIILDGGVVNDMSDIIDYLHTNAINYEYFEEEDLNNLVTAITVIADDRVWNKKEYMDFDYWITTQEKYMETIYSGYNKSSFPTANKEKRQEAYKEWIELMGGESNVKLRELISSKRLSQ